MAKTVRFSVSMTEAEKAIADTIAGRLGIPRSELFRHLILYQGLCGGSMPLTTRILDLPEADRDRVIDEILERARENDPAKPQSFALWVRETLGKADKDSLDAGAKQLLEGLLDEAEKRRSMENSEDPADRTR